MKKDQKQLIAIICAIVLFFIGCFSCATCGDSGGNGKTTCKNCGRASVYALGYCKSCYKSFIKWHDELD